MRGHFYWALTGVLHTLALIQSVPYNGGRTRSGTYEIESSVSYRFVCCELSGRVLPETGNGW